MSDYNPIIENTKSRGSSKKTRLLSAGSSQHNIKDPNFGKARKSKKLEKLQESAA